MAARRRQAERGQINARIEVAGMREHCALEPKPARLLEQACERLNLSARAHHRILRVARTIADLDDSDRIEMPHLTEAIGYRQLERKS